MKKIYLTFLALACLSLHPLFSNEASAQCTFGNASANYTQNPDFGANFLLGTIHNNPSTLQLTHLSMLGRGTGASVQMAIYTHTGGGPGAYITKTNVETVDSGVLNFQVINPTTLAPGNYWIMAIYDGSGSNTNHTFFNNSVSNTVFYTPLTFGALLPATGSGFQSYSNSDFKYWASSIESETQNITSCGPFTWVDGVTYNSSTTAEYFLPGSTAGDCDANLTLNLTVLPALNLGVTTSGNILTSSQSGASYVWINCADNNPIPGATGQSYTATETGDYAVVVSTVDCSDTSACVNVTISGSGLEDVYGASGIRVFPNPAKDMLNLVLPKPAQVRILSITGLVLRDFEAGTESSIDISELKAGIYFIHVNNEIRRFIKQ